MFLNHRRRVRVLKAFAPAAILGSALMCVPALACKNPALAPTKMSATAVPEAIMDDLLPDDATSLFADYSLVDGSADYSFVDGNGSGSVVGMWHGVLRIGDANGLVFDEFLQHFHSDGTELILSNGFPPALGNVCIGIWKRTGPGAYKIKHMTWNWSPETGGFGVPGTFAGHFELQVRLRLARGGDAYRGTWKAQNFDTEGKHLPELDVAGVVIGKRISIN
jgi:hypothetical protein